VLIKNLTERDFTVEKRCTACKTKKRSEEELRSLTNRLKRIEGQVRGILGMLEGDAYCADILIQVSAVSSALSSFKRELLSSHIKSCVAEDIKAGKDEKLDELVELLPKLMG
jgi:DNA-binding FrmR family transcriptional regulator